VPLRVAILSAEYPPFHWGGVGTLAHGLANGLAGAGHQVTVFTRAHDLPPVENHPSIEFVKVPWLKFPMAFALSFGRNAAKAVIAKGPGAFDIIEVQSNMTLLPKAAYAALPAPILTHMSGSWQGERSQLRLSNISPFSVSGLNDLAVRFLSPLYDKYEDFALLNSDGVVVESDSEERALNARLANRRPREAGSGRFLSERPHVERIYGPLDVGAFDPGKRDEALRSEFVKGDGKLFLFVGRLAGRKNPKEAVRILAKYVRGGGNAALLVVGEGNQAGPMRALARRLGVGDRLHLRRALPFSELQRIYASSDLFVFTALWEGFGYVMVEAAASGVPVLCRGIGGAPEAVPPEVGAAYTTVEDAVAKVPALLQLDRGRLSRRTKEVFSYSKSVAQYAALMERLIEERRTRPAGKSPSRGS
jgi:glycosyltransferase involved in cell wall biosynthesis